MGASPLRLTFWIACAAAALVLLGSAAGLLAGLSLGERAPRGAGAAVLSERAAPAAAGPAAAEGGDTGRTAGAAGDGRASTVAVGAAATPAATPGATASPGGVSAVRTAAPSGAAPGQAPASATPAPPAGGGIVGERATGLTATPVAPPVVAPPAVGDRTALLDRLQRALATNRGQVPAAGAPERPAGNDGCTSETHAVSTRTPDGVSIQSSSSWVVCSSSR